MTAILVGFQYSLTTIPGTIVDLYRAFCFSKKRGWKINIITDISDPKLPSGIHREIVEDKVDPEVLSFLETKEFSAKLLVHDVEEFNKTIRNKLKTAESKIFIYYTGHGEDGSMVFPNNEKFQFSDFKNLILEEIPCTSKIFMVLDCCHPSNFSLPFQIKNKKFRLVDKWKPINHDLILVTSSKSNETSTASTMGSFFSKYFFDKVNNENIGKILENIRNSVKSIHKQKQTVSAYTSFPKHPVLWSWITGSKFEIKEDGIIVLDRD